MLQLTMEKVRQNIFALKLQKRRELCHKAGSVFDKQGDFIHA
jgi:hypothetical protein